MLPAVMRGGPVELAEHVGGQPLAAADHRQPDVLLHQLGPLDDQEMAEQPHQELQLARRPLPVLDREAVERELVEAEPAPFLDDGADALDPPAVARDPGQAPALGPAAVAVHDDGDVPGQLLGPQPERRDPRQAFLGDRGVGMDAVPRSSRARRRSSRALALDPCVRSALEQIVCRRSGPTETIETGTPICSARKST